MKICIVTPNFTGGGAERIAVNLANCYSEQGVEVAIAVFRFEGPYKTEVSASVRIFDLKAAEIWRRPQALATLFREQNFDIILSVIRGSNIYVGIARLFSPKSYVIFREASTMHGLTLKSAGFFRHFAFRIAMSFSYRMANKVIANSHDTRKDLQKKCLLNKKNVTVIANPVLSSDFKALSEEKLDYPQLSEDRLILTVGRLHPLKNHKMLIAAFSKVRQKLDNVRLIILGEGEERGNLVNFAKAEGIEDSVDFIEFQKNPYPWYRNADLFVLTSRWEGFGNVLVEAMACGTPVISTNCPGGPKEILENGKYGDLVEVDDVEGLSELMIKNLLHPDTVRIEVAREKALEFQVDRVARKYIEPYVVG